MSSVANLVRLYLRNKPYILEGLEKGIINLSELSRRIQKELKLQSFHAVKAAVRRYAEQRRRIKHKREEKVLRLLKKSRIKLIEGISVVIANEEIELETIAKVRVDSAFVYLTQLPIEKLKKYLEEKDITLHRNCVALIISSPEDIEKIPGVVAFLTSILAEDNINIIEFISCYTETIIVIDRGDSLRAYEILIRVIGE